MALHQLRLVRGGRAVEAVQVDEHRAQSAASSFWWMPPKPPFDITRTWSPSRASAAIAATSASQVRLAAHARARAARTRRRIPGEARVVDVDAVGVRRSSPAARPSARPASACSSAARTPRGCAAALAILAGAGRRWFRGSRSDGARNRRRRATPRTVPRSSMPPPHAARSGRARRSRRRARRPRGAPRAIAASAFMPVVVARPGPSEAARAPCPARQPRNRPSRPARPPASRRARRTPRPASSSLGQVLASGPRPCHCYDQRPELGKIRTK